MIKLIDVHKKYLLGKQTVHAVRGVSAEIDSGEFVAFAGPSGSGKTTLLNLVGCMDRATSGEVWVDGQLTSKLSEKELTHLRLEKLGFVFQSFNLMPVLNVFRNVEIPLLLQGMANSSQRNQRVLDAIEAVGLTKQLRQRPTELSGGQQQRVAIARALVKEPRLVLADEPTANLDSTTGYQIIDLMRKLGAEKKTTFVFSTHDPKIMTNADRVINVADGVVSPLEATN